MRKGVNFDPKLLDFLINMEKEREKSQNEQYERPFAQIPLKKPVFDEKNDENDENDEKTDENGVIEMDI